MVAQQLTAIICARNVHLIRVLDQHSGWLADRFGVRAEPLQGAAVRGVPQPRQGLPQQGRIMRPSSERPRHCRPRQWPAAALLLQLLLLLALGARGAAASGSGGAGQGTPEQRLMDWLISKGAEVRAVRVTRLLRCMPQARAPKAFNGQGPAAAALDCSKGLETACAAVLGTGS